MEKTIIDLLKQYDKKYHTVGQPEIPDTEYDKLKAEARKKYPNDPYFQTVGASTIGEKIDLPYVLGSLDKMKIDTVKDWLNKYPAGTKFQASEKLDGASFYVKYENGKVVWGSTRGDGSVGQNISDKLQMVCPNIRVDNIHEFRGELVLKKNVDLKKIERKGRPVKNRRNGVVGIINAEELERVKYITPIFYEVLSISDQKNITPHMGYHILEALNLPTPKWITFENSDNIVKELTEILAKWKAEAEYDIDGLVLSVYDEKRENIMIPEHKVAFKVNEDAVPVRVTGIEWTTSRMGYVIPVILLEPTELDGVTISRASGFNAQFIHDEGIELHAIVGLVRSGGVIPFITEVLKPSPFNGLKINNKKENCLINKCPSCNKKLSWSGVHLKCSNPKCKEMRLYYLEHFIKTMEIESITVTTLKNLQLYSIEDLYNLTEDKIIDTEGFGYKRATEICNQIKNSLTTKPYKLLAAFGIPLIGKTASKTILSNYKFNELFDLDEYRDSLGLGPTISQSFFDHINEYREIYNFLVDKGLSFEEEKKSMLSGKEFALTGKGSMGRKELTEMIENLGGSVRTVSKSTDYLVCENPNTGSVKLQKAEKYGTKIISYDDLMKMLGE